MILICQEARSKMPTLFGEVRLQFLVSRFERFITNVTGYTNFTRYAAQAVNFVLRHFNIALASLLIVGYLGQLSAKAGNPPISQTALPVAVSVNPVAQGTVTFTTGTGPQPTMTINQTSASAYINWASFDIGQSASVNFNQPSATSVTWNQIGGGSYSDIEGKINAPGYVILQNPSGFYVGGQASISTHGLVMTTASSLVPNFTSSGPWSFNTPPPLAKIINYGQINMGAGGSAFLIASDIENNGTISAPGGKIGLYDGQTVLVSTSPDGRGLSAQVTLPQGSVDNEGKLIADGGSIVAQAKTVNQNGLIQANSVQSVNGVIELLASDSLNLGANSVISAKGNITGVSSGGDVTLKSDNAYEDQTGSTIDISGGVQGGNGGSLNISAKQWPSLQSQIIGQGEARYADSSLSIETTSILLNGDGSLSPGNLAINVNSLESSFSKINIQADDNIEVDSTLNLPVKSGMLNSVSLNAGNTLTIDAGLNSVSLNAGNTLTIDAGSGIKVDAGKISLTGKTVYQNGLLQANSVNNANGVIEVNASDSLNMGGSSDLEAHGDSTSLSSPGGFVVLHSANNYVDTASSQIHVEGVNGGQNGLVEILGNGSVLSQMGSQFKYLNNPNNVTLSDNSTDTASPNPNINVADLAAYSGIDLHALNNINLGTIWAPAASGPIASLNLSAGNNINFGSGAGIKAGWNWNVNLNAGPSGLLTKPAAQTDGVYLSSNSQLQTQNGNINVWAANEVILQPVDVDPTSHLIDNSSSSAIRTLARGNVSVSAQFGDVNTGNNIFGYTFGLNSAPYYHVNAAALGGISTAAAAALGGISTAAGGNVTITAGGNVTSYLPTQADYNNPFCNSRYDGGTGAFGPDGGNVTIRAGGTVSGNYVLANGVGTITAGGNVGVPLFEDAANGFALSLIKGSWSVNAPNIYLADVINPNGVFNDSTSRKSKAGAHYFDYDSNASLLLNAANAVEITGAGIPLYPGSSPNVEIPVLLPPTLQIITGTGGLTLDTDVILFPSPFGNLNISTHNGGNFESRQNPINPYDVNTYNLVMSDSANKQWVPAAQNASVASEVFGYGDHAAKPTELNNLNPVLINVSGSINNVNLYATKQTQITVGGNMYNAGFIGENIHSTDESSISVAGFVSYSPIYVLTGLTKPIVSADPLNASWDSIFYNLVNADPNDLNSIVKNPIPYTDIGKNSALLGLAKNYLVFQSATPNPGFVYSPATLQLGYAYQMSSLVRNAMEALTVIKRDSYGNPVIQSGLASMGQDPSQFYFVTTTVPFVSSTVIEALYNQSRGFNPNGSPNPIGAISVKDSQALSPGLQIGGFGHLDIQANSLDLGASGGIISWGIGDGSQQPHGVNYASIGQATGDGAIISINVVKDLDMLTSTIASIDGGSVTVKSTSGNINLGLGDLPFSPPAAGNLAYGIYTSGNGDVNVAAHGNINIDSARIATFNGGNVHVQSFNGDVNAGNGINQTLMVPVVYVDQLTKRIVNTAIQNPRPYGSGIMALSPTAQFQTLGSSGLPGNITVETPNGDIVSTLGGISQFALDGNITGGPTINLTAGTAGVNYIKDPNGVNGRMVNGIFHPEGNIDLGKGGVIGGTVNVDANGGSVSGLIISRQNSSVHADQNANVTVLSGGKATVSAGGGLSGLLVANGGINASGGEGVSATMVSQSVSANGGASQSTLGTATASSASQSAANQSGVSAKKELASNDASEDDDKKRKSKPVLTRIKRVTVLLPKAS